MKNGSSQTSPKVSVVTVCRNAGLFIEKTLQSVAEQKFSSFEYVVIDGLSTDNTVNIINKYREKINILVSENDAGIYNAMNKAVSCASGVWIIFMNAGDTFASNDVLSNVFENPDYPIPEHIDVVFGNTIQVRSVGNFILPNHPLDFLTEGMPFCHQSVFVKTAQLRQMPFDEKYRIAADYDFLRKLYIARKEFLYIPLEISCYEAEGGASAKNRLLGKKENAMIRGIDKNISWKITYAYDLLVMGFKLFYKTFIPSGFIDAIRHLNYRRKEKRKYRSCENNER